MIGGIPKAWRCHGPRLQAILKVKPLKSLPDWRHTTLVIWSFEDVPMGKIPPKPASINMCLNLWKTPFMVCPRIRIIQNVVITGEARLKMALTFS